MGNQALALGAIAAGVGLVSGYPGTPSTEILETVAKRNPGDIYVEWSVNEKAALEVAAGGAYAESSKAAPGIDPVAATIGVAAVAAVGVGVGGGVKKAKAQAKADEAKSE